MHVLYCMPSDYFDLKSIILNEGDFILEETFGNTWRHFRLSHLDGGGDGATGN